MRIIGIEKLNKEKFLEKQCLKAKLSLGIKRPVYCVTTKESFGSIREASIAYKLDPCSISKVCKKKQHNTKGFIFRYAFDLGNNNVK